MTILLIVVALVVVTSIAVFAVGSVGRLREDTPDREPADLPEGREVEAADIDRVRFAIGVRGYRMDQVDGVLDRVASELRARADREIALTDQLRALGHEPEPVQDVAQRQQAAAAEVTPGPGARDSGAQAASAVAPDADARDAGEHG